MQSLSASLYTATVLTPSFLAVRMIRQAISPLLFQRCFGEKRRGGGSRRTGSQ